MSGSMTTTWAESVIRQSLTQPYYIAKIDGIHSALRFQAVPMLFHEIEEAEETIINGNAKQRSTHIVKKLAESIKSWNLDAPINEETIARLRRPQIIKAYEMISSQRPSDTDPEVQDLPPEDSTIEGKLGN